jgi:hypothetical protein
VPFTDVDQSGLDEVEAVEELQDFFVGRKFTVGNPVWWLMVPPGLTLAMLSRKARHGRVIPGSAQAFPAVNLNRSGVLKPGCFRAWSYPFSFMAKSAPIPGPSWCGNP